LILFVYVLFKIEFETRERKRERGKKRGRERGGGRRGEREIVEDNQFENEFNCRTTDVKSLRLMKRTGDTKVPIPTLNQGKQVTGIGRRKQKKREREK